MLFMAVIGVSADGSDGGEAGQSNNILGGSGGCVQRHQVKVSLFTAVGAPENFGIRTLQCNVGEVRERKVVE